MITFQQTPDYLTIGHIAKDIIPNGAILGGTCGYSAVTAHRLGQRVAAITSYTEGIPSLEVMNGVSIKNVPARDNTTFENIYEDGKRRQKWWATSSHLTLDHIPPAWRVAPIVHLAPLSQEMSPALCGDFPDSLICVTAQGWLRGQSEVCDVIYHAHPDLDEWLPEIDIMVLSLADTFGNRDVLTHLLDGVKLGIETLGPQGCKIYCDGQVRHIPVIPQEEIDPTGAGDIFAAAFFIRYRETGDCQQSAQFANACASLSVRRQGMDSSPNRPETEAQLAKIYGDTA